MSRTPLFRQLANSMRTALHLEEKGVPTREGMEQLAEERQFSRRTFLGTAAVAGAAAAIPGCAMDVGSSTALLPRASGDVGIVGAGIAGLGCARALADFGLVATVHEGGDRVGGRCYSLGGVFPGQVVERGGELIDTGHVTMRGWANEFGLTMESYLRDSNDIHYFIDGRSVDEAVVVDEFRVFVDAMRDDLRTIGAPTADVHTDSDRALDLMTLSEYLDSRGAGPVIKKVIDVAYTIEYGLDVEQQSALNFLLFIHADRRSKFTPFGVWSDEKYHVVEGNQRIPEGLAATIPGRINFGRMLVRAAKKSDGRVELTFREGNRTVTAVHDAVVFATPFSTLREVDLDPSLGLPDWKIEAIEGLGYGTNAKQIIGFGARTWAQYGSNGTSYSDLANHQATWETNPSGATANRAVLTDYAGGARGAAMRSGRTELFLADLERIWPGATAAARRPDGSFLTHVENWTNNPLARGSYTCNLPGYFTTIADNEAKPVGNLFFAGEHTSSFYEWQGFMEGAALSGLRAAGEVGELLRGRQASVTPRMSRRSFFA